MLAASEVMLFVEVKKQNDPTLEAVNSRGQLDTLEPVSENDLVLDNLNKDIESTHCLKRSL